MRVEAIEPNAISAIDDGMWQVRAAAWEFMALSFRYPDAMLAQVISSGEWTEAAVELAQELSLALPDDFEQRLAVYKDTDADDMLHTLRAEATRLFVGAPTPVVSPYEGARRAEAEGVQPLLFVNPHSMAVERFMAACGLGRPEGTNEPLDHVATECELLQHLASCTAGLSELSAGANMLPGGSAQGAYDTFLAEHARQWMPEFAQAVTAQSREVFFRESAVFLEFLVG